MNCSVSFVVLALALLLTTSFPNPLPNLTLHPTLHPTQEREILDSSFMSVRELRAFYEKEIASAYKDDMLLSLHLKATMMKVRGLDGFLC
jgi:hypothetical protein